MTGQHRCRERVARAATPFQEEDVTKVPGILAGAVLLANLAISPALAQQQAMRIRGTVEAVDGAMLAVKSRDGKATYKVKLTDNVAVRGIVKAALSDIKDNSYIGVTGMPQSDGSQKAVEIHIFPEPLRGVGEGHRPWDLAPNSTMTNATVAQVVKGVEGNEITLKYKDGEQKIMVPNGTPIIGFDKGDRSALRKGEAIWTNARVEGDGKLVTNRIQVGKGGVKPEH